MKIKTMKFNKKGNVAVAVGGVISLIVGLGVATLVQIFVGVLGGKVYQQTEADINLISNSTVRDSIKNGIVSSFQANEQTGDMLPIVALSFMIILVLGLLVGMFQFGGGGSFGGSAL